MNLHERIIHNQQHELSLHIGIDGIAIPGNLKQRVLDAIYNAEDFALINDSGSYAYFIQEGFMVYVSNETSENSVTLLRDKLAWQNSLKVVLLGHRKFVSQKVLMLNANYIYLKDGLKREALILPQKSPV